MKLARGPHNRQTLRSLTRYVAGMVLGAAFSQGKHKMNRRVFFGMVAAIAVAGSEPVPTYNIILSMWNAEHLRRVELGHRKRYQLNGDDFLIESDSSEWAVRWFDNLPIPVGWRKV